MTANPKAYHRDYMKAYRKKRKMVGLCEECKYFVEECTIISDAEIIVGVSPSTFGCTLFTQRKKEAK